MSLPGQYPNNPGRLGPRQVRISLDELKPVPCQACGAHRRYVLSWVEQMVHRLNKDIQATNRREAWFCLGCDRQLDVAGQEVPEEDPGFVSPVEREALRRTQ